MLVDFCLSQIFHQKKKQLESAIEKFLIATQNKNLLNQFIIIQEFINNAKQVGVLFSPIQTIVCHFELLIIIIQKYF